MQMRVKRPHAPLIRSGHIPRHWTSHHDVTHYVHSKPLYVQPSSHYMRLCLRMVVCPIHNTDAGLHMNTVQRCCHPAAIPRPLWILTIHSGAPDNRPLTVHKPLKVVVIGIMQRMGISAEALLGLATFESLRLPLFLLLPRERAGLASALMGSME